MNVLTGRRDRARGTSGGSRCPEGLWKLYQVRPTQKDLDPSLALVIVCKSQCPYKRVRPDELESAISLAGDTTLSSGAAKEWSAAALGARRMKESPSSLLLHLFWILPQIQMAPFTFSSIQQFPPTCCSSLPRWFWLPTVMTASSLPEQLLYSCCQLCFLE